MAGHKGFALSLWNEALAVLAGGVGAAPDAPPLHTFQLEVYDPDAFTGSRRFEEGFGRTLRWLSSSRPRGSGTGSRFPGRRRLALRCESRESGIPLAEETLQALASLGARLGVPAAAWFEEP